ncbi:uncharacterized protein [Dermacentor andersoni]|uniref:uncharacterized protein isoform X2 n=1 Tax=Dermacentor andersoni TaxID=34620 RepID=UPI0024170CB5|nr:uncharacterized protein LOC126537799 isoform X2 [Dermacentor andersoni]
MAFHLTPLENLTTEQLVLIAEHRNRNGFHAHYTGGFDASKKFFQFTCPSYMRSGCVVMTLFEYPAPSGLKGGPDEDYPISLGTFTDHEGTSVKLIFRGTDQMKVERRHNGNTMILDSWEGRNSAGLHILHYEIENNSLQIPPFYNPNADFFFPHVNVQVAVGGYVLWYGAWLPGTDVAAQDRNGTRLAGAVQSPQSGEFKLLLKFYKGGCALSNADDARNIPRLWPSFKSINLDQLFINPHPVSFYEFKAVTGYINY